MAKKCVDSFTVMNDRGLHTRPSTELVKCATSFRSKVSLECGGVWVNAKSLLGILMLGAARGSKVTVEAVGSDSQEAVREILQLARNQFCIKY